MGLNLPRRVLRHFARLKFSANAVRREVITTAILTEDAHRLFYTTYTGEIPTLESGKSISFLDRGGTVVGSVRPGVEYDNWSDKSFHPQQIRESETVAEAIFRLGKKASAIRYILVTISDFGKVEKVTIYRREWNEGGFIEYLQRRCTKGEIPWPTPQNQISVRSRPHTFIVKVWGFNRK